MPIFIDVPGVVAPVDDNWTPIISVPSTFPLDGLAFYNAIENAVLSSGRLQSMALWVGSTVMSAPYTATVDPLIVTVGSASMMQTTKARGDRLVIPPIPAGGSWPFTATTGFSFSFPVRVDVNSGTNGFLNCFGFRFQSVLSSGTSYLQVQKTYSGGTANLMPATTITDLMIVGITYDTATTTLKIYKNGVLIGTSVSVNWEAPTASVAVFGSTYNPGTPSDATFGDLVGYSRAITDAEMLEVSDYLSDRFGVV